MSESAAETMSDVIPETPGRRAIPFANIAIGLAALLVIGLIAREAGAFVPRFAP